MTNKVSPNKYIKAILPVLQRDLTNSALAAGWPRSLAKSLVIYLDGNQLTVSYPEDLSKDIEDLEYGTIDSSPASVIRTFVNHHDAIIAKAISEWAVDSLSEGLAI